MKSRGSEPPSRGLIISIRNAGTFHPGHWSTLSAVTADRGPKSSTTSTTSLSTTTMFTWTESESSSSTSLRGVRPFKRAGDLVGSLSSASGSQGVTQLNWPSMLLIQGGLHRSVQSFEQWVRLGALALGVQNLRKPETRTQIERMRFPEHAGPARDGQAGAKLRLRLSMPTLLATAGRDSAGLSACRGAFRPTRRDDAGSLAPDAPRQAAFDLPNRAQHGLGVRIASLVSHLVSERTASGERLGVVLSLRVWEPIGRADDATPSLDWSRMPKIHTRRCGRRRNDCSHSRHSESPGGSNGLKGALGGPVSAVQSHESECRLAEPLVRNTHR